MVETAEKVMDSLRIHVRMREVRILQAKITVEEKIQQIIKMPVAVRDRQVTHVMAKCNPAIHVMVKYNPVMCITESPAGNLARDVKVSI